MTLPTKELLSVVLDEYLSIEDINWIEEEDNRLVIHNYDNDSFEYTINIYELMHKMKEWASTIHRVPGTNSRHFLTSGLYQTLGGTLAHPNIRGFCKHNFYGGQFQEDSEPEAVTKACEWILTHEV